MRKFSIPGPKQIEVPVWWNNGITMYRRDCLDPKHEGSTYSYIKNELGLNPNDYGYYLCGNRPDLVKLTKEELIDKVIKLEQEIEFREKWGTI